MKNIILTDIEELKALLGVNELPQPRNNTEASLYLALNRLIAQKPNHPKNLNGKVNFSAIHREAEVSNGTIKSYPEFRATAETAIKAHKLNISLSYQTNDESSPEESETSLQQQTRLKKEYFVEMNALSASLDLAVLRESELIFRLHELEVQLKQEWNSKVHELNQDEDLNSINKQ
ncbi:hypothetical protein [Vibrio splendidus]|uniref:hypothetical protein n=1 Tax=Vibrio splendidus TaxID=29497 RepID=UPI000D34FD71|nr:hypothetical protein [Vibrio splendidus]PTO62409.1 hypothetical protein CWN99_18345 [Vibrio splendidus]